MFQGGYEDFKGLTETYRVEEGTSWGRNQELPASQPEGKPSVEICEYPAKLEGPPSHLLQQICRLGGGQTQRASLSRSPVQPVTVLPQTARWQAELPLSNFLVLVMTSSSPHVQFKKKTKSL